MVDFITAIGLVFVIEGLFYVIAPNRLKTMILMMEDIPAETLRNLGVLAVGIGVAIVWIAKSLLSS